MDYTGIEIRPEILEWFRQPAPDQLDIALASGPVSAEEAAHCRRFICILQFLQRFLFFSRKEALRNSDDLRDRRRRYHRSGRYYSKNQDVRETRAFLRECAFRRTVLLMRACGQGRSQGQQQSARGRGQNPPAQWIARTGSCRAMERNVNLPAGSLNYRLVLPNA